MVELKSKCDAATRADWLVFAILSACVLIPIWIVRYPAPGDYWNQLLKARIVANYADPFLGYSRYYQISFLPIPNMASTLVTALLMKLFAPMIAGKLLLSIYAITFPLSSRYLVRCAGVRFRPLEYIGFTMVYNPCFWDGYIDFCLSAAVAQFAIGYWLKNRDVLHLRHVAAYLALALLTYFAHFWGFVVLMGVTLLLAVGECRAKRLLWLGTAGVAAVLLFIYSRGTSERLSIYYFGATYTLSLARNFVSLPRLAGLPADAAHFASAAVLTAIRLSLLGLLFTLAARTKNRLFWVGLVLLVGFFFLPNQLGRMREPGQRTLVFVPTILAAAVAAYPTRRTARALSLLVLGCTGFAVLFAGRAWVEKDRQLSVYHDALMQIPAHSRVLNVVTLSSPYLNWPWKMLGGDMYRSEGFFGANYNLEKGGFYLHTFTTGVVKVRKGASPVRPWFMMDSSFEWPEWLRANMGVVSRNFDYVVVVGPADKVEPLLLANFVPCRQLNGCMLMTNRTNTQRAVHNP